MDLKKPEPPSGLDLKHSPLQEKGKTARDKRMAWQIGVDVGGTFTDLLALDPERGVFRVAKVPSTPEDQSVGFIAGLAELETDLAASPLWFTALPLRLMRCSNAREPSVA